MIPPRVVILGAGRVGCALHRGLAAVGNAPVLLWTRSEATARAALDEGFPATYGELPAITCDIALLAVSDGAVEELARTLPGRPRRCQPPGRGALDLARLAGAGTNVGSLHPVVSIASRATPLAGNAAAIDSSTPEADAALAQLAESLGMRVIRPRGDRARYHAACSVAGNFPQALLEAAVRLGAACGLSREDAIAAFGPLLVSAAGNAAERGPAEGLTGPVRRGDIEVVRRHLAAIAGSDVEALYRSASMIAIDLAESIGAPNTDHLRRIVGNPASK